MSYKKREKDSHKPAIDIIAPPANKQANAKLEEQLEALDKLNGLLADLTKEEIATFDRILKDHPTFSRLP